MQAKIRKDGDITVVELRGRLDFETAEPFRETCHDILSNSKVVFNLAELSFVGSSGIGAFVNTLREFTKASPVRKVFKATDEMVFQIFDDEQTAVVSFNEVAPPPL